MKHTVTLTMTVEAPTPDDALGIGIGAAEHLTDTFNDDESLDPIVGVHVNPPQPDDTPPSPDPLRLALRQALALLEDPEAEAADADRVATVIRAVLGDTETCRSDGRCQYAIDSGAEDLGHCPAGKCLMPGGQPATTQPGAPS